MLRTFVLLMLLSLAFHTLRGQNIEVNSLELNGSEIVIHYNLNDTVPERSYSINIYASHDNFINPLTRVKGDVGMDIASGRNKKIIWNAKDELGAEFDGSISVEVRARVYIPFIRFDGIESFKRGKPTEVTWRGGTYHNVLNFELFRGDKRVAVIPNIANVGNTKITIPTDVKPGKNYRFRISDNRNKDQVVETKLFSIRRKTPLIVKIAPVVALGAIYLLVKPSSEEGIPDPISPPVNDN